MCQLVFCDDLEEWEGGKGGERVVQREVASSKTEGRAVKLTLGTGVG